MLRQGNIYREVFSFVYVTEGSFDSYVWQILETKARFIAQFLTGNTQVREMDDIGDTVLSMAEIKALASGNPKIIERVVLQNEVVKLENLRASWQSNRHSDRIPIERHPDRGCFRWAFWIKPYIIWLSIFFNNLPHRNGNNWGKSFCKDGGCWCIDLYGHHMTTADNIERSKISEKKEEKPQGCREEDVQRQRRRDELQRQRLAPDDLYCVQHEPHKKAIEQDIQDNGPRKRAIFWPQYPPTACWRTPTRIIYKNWQRPTRFLLPNATTPAWTGHSFWCTTRTVAINWLNGPK